MRTVFLAVVLLNVAYFAWARWVDAPVRATASSTAHLPKLRLANEVPAADRASAATPVKAAEADTGPCFSVGPFADVDNSAKAAALLRAKGFDPRQRAEAADGTAGYWVFVGGLKSDADADKALVTLEHGGIKDALVMPASADAGRRLSLGLFSERARAERRAQSIHALGLNAEVAERKLPGTVYWVDLAPLPGMSTVPIQDLFAEGVSSRIAVQTCPPAVHLGAAGAPDTQTAAATPHPAPVADAAPPKTVANGVPAH